MTAWFYGREPNMQQYTWLQLRTVKELKEGKGIERPSNVAAADETFENGKGSSTGSSASREVERVLRLEEHQTGALWP
jgi:hypothetical protein